MSSVIFNVLTFFRLRNYYFSPMAMLIIFPHCNNFTQLRLIYKNNNMQKSKCYFKVGTIYSVISNISTFLD